MLNIDLWSNPKFTNKKSIPVTYQFQSGITMLIGSNGTGKSTSLRQIKSVLTDGSWAKIDSNNELSKQYSCYYYDNEYEEQHRKQSWLDSDNTEISKRFAFTFENSEGQNIWDYLFYQLSDIGATVRKAKEDNKKGIFLLFDGLDSGLSLDKIYKLKKELLNFIIETDNNDNFEIYLICTANSYEMVKGYTCLDIVTNKHIMFHDYEDYENYFIGKE